MTDLTRTDNGGAPGTYHAVFDSAFFHHLARFVDVRNVEPNELIAMATKDGLLKPMRNLLEPAVNPFLMHFEGPTVPNPIGVKILEQMPHTKRAPFQIDWEQLERTPELIKYQETGHTWTPPAGPDGYAYLAYEIGRFITPRNAVGIVRTLGTALTLEDPAERWPKNDPMWLQRFDVDIKWYLRIENIDPANPPDPLAFRGPYNLPGQPYPPLPQWVEMRFPYDQHNPVFLVVPEKTLLSLWCEFQNNSCDAILRNLSGVMRGFTQPQGSARTYENLTLAW